MRKLLSDVREIIKNYLAWKYDPRRAVIPVHENVTINLKTLESCRESAECESNKLSRDYCLWNELSGMLYNEALTLEFSLAMLLDFL
jgi:hypothetical protein